jgi:predicted lipid-binding transport protein (Tim44 family)
VKRTRIVDHRGEIHRICRVSDLPEGASDTLRNTVHAANAHRASRFLPALGGMAGGALLTALLLQRARLEFFTGGIMAITVCALLLLFTLPFAPRRARRAGKACVDAGVCAACGYPVAGTEAQPDSASSAPNAAPRG